MKQVLYSTRWEIFIKIACPNCKIVSKYDVGFIEDAIKENKPITCVACEEGFGIVTKSKIIKPLADFECTCKEPIPAQDQLGKWCKSCGKPINSIEQKASQK